MRPVFEWPSNRRATFALADEPELEEPSRRAVSAGARWLAEHPETAKNVLTNADEVKREMLPVMRSAALPAQLDEAALEVCLHHAVIADAHGWADYLDSMLEPEGCGP